MPAKRTRSRPANIFAHVERVRRLGRNFSSLEDFVPHGDSEPTDATPGTEEKIRVLQSRVNSGRELWSSGDRGAFQPTQAEVWGRLMADEEA